ncbi:MAG: lysostaphin resistance A-like protein [Thermoplasmata archaeon]
MGGAPFSATARVPDRLGRYALGVVITVVAVLSQYFVPQLGAPARAVYGTLAGDVAVVYGIPVVAFALLIGAGPLRNWKDRMGRAAIEGLSWYGLLSLLGLAVLVVLVIIYEAVDPGALALLNRPNPALTQAASDPWFYVGFSFAVGAFEETIFRGWIFGFWRDRRVAWVVPAVGSSVLFAGMHLYYATTYAAAAPLIFPGLFLIGFAFAATYRASGGNLVVIAFLHGAHDAAAYYTLINPVGGEIAYYLVILVAAVVGGVYFLSKREDTVLAPI